MPRKLSSRFWSTGVAFLAAGLLAASWGCSTGGSGWEVFGSPFPFVGSTGGSTPPTGGSTGGGGLGGGGGTATDPCDIEQSRKFVTISMRNLSEDYVHYFFVAIAFIDVEDDAAAEDVPGIGDQAFIDGGVCADDVALYQQFGYVPVAAGQQIAFGDYCLYGPALYYFHRSGQFRRSATPGNAGLASAIAPAQGSSPTYDNFFTSSGAQVPVPDLILFHNPGTGEGAALKVSSQTSSPCDIVLTGVTPVCNRDAFYYVDEDDRITGSTALGFGAGRRVPSEIQGMGCECLGAAQAYQVLAPPGTTSRTANCDEFMRGGRIDYVFLRQDENPPVPQLVWRVTDSSGSVAHEFDARATIP